MIVCVIGPPISCQVFSFGDAKVSKKKDAMLMLSFFCFLKKSYIFGQLNGVLRRHGASDRWSFGGPSKSWYVKDLPK